MPMRMKTVQSNAIKTLFEVQKDLLTDVNITFDEHGMRMLAMDGARVALVHIKLNGADIEQYSCSQRYTLGINLTYLYKLLKSIGNNDTVCFEIFDSALDTLVLTLENLDKNCVYEYKLKLLDIDEEPLQIPDVQFDKVISMPSVDFARYCRDMKDISESVQIHTSRNDLTFNCVGEFSSCCMNIGETQNGVSFDGREDVRGNFALRYLSTFSKSFNLSNYVELMLKNNYPLILHYNVASLGYVRYCLAPKVSEETST